MLKLSVEQMRRAVEFGSEIQGYDLFLRKLAEDVDGAFGTRSISMHGVGVKIPVEVVKEQVRLRQAGARERLAELGVELAPEPDTLLQAVRECADEVERAIASAS